jgi:hypothetical protein
MILSDGSLEQMGKHARLRIEQKDREFALHLWILFDSLALVGAKLRESSHLDKRSGKTTFAYAIATFTLPYFTELRKEWYTKVNGRNIQVVPSNIAALITPRVLAYWLAGVGHYNKTQGTIHIYTNSFTPEQVDLLRAALLQNFNIESTRNVVNKAKEQYIIVYQNVKFLKLSL